MLRRREGITPLSRDTKRTLPARDYSAVLSCEGRRCSGQRATNPRASIIPSETSMNRCKAVAHVASEHGIRTMIIRVMLA